MDYVYFEKLLNELLAAERNIEKSKSNYEFTENIDKRNNLRMKLCDYVYKHIDKPKQDSHKSTDMSYMDIHSNYDLGLVD